MTRLTDHAKRKQGQLRQADAKGHTHTWLYRHSRLWRRLTNRALNAQL